MPHKFQHVAFNPHFVALQALTLRPTNFFDVHPRLCYEKKAVVNLNFVSLRPWILLSHPFYPCSSNKMPQKFKHVAANPHFVAFQPWSCGSSTFPMFSMEMPQKFKHVADNPHFVAFQPLSCGSSAFPMFPFEMPQKLNMWQLTRILWQLTRILWQLTRILWLLYFKKQLKNIL